MARLVRAQMTLQGKHGQQLRLRFLALHRCEPLFLQELELVRGEGRLAQDFAEQPECIGEVFAGCLHPAGNDRPPTSDGDPRLQPVHLVLDLLAGAIGRTAHEHR